MGAREHFSTATWELVLPAFSPQRAPPLSQHVGLDTGCASPDVLLRGSGPAVQSHVPSPTLSILVPAVAMQEKLA
jgi:hypothetical protein